jgi:hypothetical protein
MYSFVYEIRKHFQLIKKFIVRIYEHLPSLSGSWRLPQFFKSMVAMLEFIKTISSDFQKSLLQKIHKT